MGYTTEYSGSVSIEPPLNPAEIAYLRAFAATRQMARQRGPYYVGEDESDAYDHGNAYDRANDKPSSHWCDWEPTDDGAALKWNGTEKFYFGAEWMRYVIDHFLRPGAKAYFVAADDPQFAAFTFDHVVNGAIDAQGEDPADRWVLDVKNNVVSQQGDGES